MTPLRRKMIEEFQIRHYATGMEKSYLHCVSRFEQHFDRSLGSDWKAASTNGAGRTALAHCGLPS